MAFKKVPYGEIHILLIERKTKLQPNVFRKEVFYRLQVNSGNAIAREKER
jgi:hypothetical protein